MQMKKSLVAESGAPRAMEMAPSTWRSPVSRVRSNGMGGKSRSSRVAPPWITSIFTGLWGWLAGVTVR